MVMWPNELGVLKQNKNNDWVNVTNLFLDGIGVWGSYASVGITDKVTTIEITANK